MQNIKCDLCSGNDSRTEREQRSYHRVDLTGCFSLTLMRITVQTQLLNLHLNKIGYEQWQT